MPFGYSEQVCQGIRTRSFGFFFEHLRDNPIPADTMMFGINYLKTVIINSLKDTQKWPVLAKQLMALACGSKAEQAAVAIALTCLTT